MMLGKLDIHMQNKINLANGFFGHANKNRGNKTKNRQMSLR
jgi:hypothetical protein